jgi:hypothetical protein
MPYIPIPLTSYPELAMTARPRTKTGGMSRDPYVRAEDHSTGCANIPLSETSRKLDEAFARRWAAFKKGPTK